MITLNQIIVLYFLAFINPTMQAQSNNCAQLAEETELLQLMLEGFEAIPEVSTEELKCMAQYYAQEDLRNGNLRLFDSAKKPFFKIDGETICVLAQYGFDSHIIKDFFVSEEDHVLIQLFIEQYNEPMLRALENKMGAETVLKLLFKKKMLLDPYVLKERLEQLKYGRSLVSLNKEQGNMLRVKINTKSMFQDLDFTFEDLGFIIIDENNESNRFELSAKEMMNKGFVLYTHQIRGRSLYWFDFKVRIDYSKLLENGEIFSCEKIEDFLFQFVHFTITKDYRLIGHDH